MTAIPLRPVAAEVRLRNVRTRMTPKYGAAVLVACPIAQLWLTVEGPAGRRVEGLAGDCLPPGWYDKRPGRSFRQDVSELLAALGEAQTALLELARNGPRSVFGFWRELYPHQIAWARQRGCTDLTGNFGTSMLERALIDAAGKLAGRSFFDSVKQGLLGLEPGAVHPFLKDWQAAEALAATPLSSIAVRHTVGGADPLVAGDVPEGGRLSDGLPQTLEEYLRAEKLRYFKVKLKGDAAWDLERMRGVARLCDAWIPEHEPYYVTLDGNEMFKDPELLTLELEQLAAGGVSARFAQAVQFVEQPYPRAVTLDAAVKPDLEKASRFKPVIVDESDENTESVPRALELGYAGFAVKSCKGPIKALLNKGAVARHPNRPRLPIVSGEDMMNLPVVPLHADLVLLAALGVTHAERNGHHFCRGLDHLASAERAALLDAHPGLYRRKSGTLVVLDTEHGFLDVRTLNARAGFSVDGGSEVEKAGMTPVTEWRFEDLGLP